MRAAFLLLLISSTLAVPAPAQERADTFEIVFAAQGRGFGHVPDRMRVAADDLRLPPGGWGVVTLARRGRAVALLQLNHVLFIARRSEEGSRVFELQLNDGTYELSADRMEQAMNGPIVFYVDDTLVGVANANQLRTVVDRAARVGAGGG